MKMMAIELAEVTTNHLMTTIGYYDDQSQVWIPQSGVRADPPSLSNSCGTVQTCSVAESNGFGIVDVRKGCCDASYEMSQ